MYDNNMACMIECGLVSFSFENVGLHIWYSIALTIQLIDTQTGISVFVQNFTRL